jgi:hypothetical protein
MVAGMIGTGVFRNGIREPDIRMTSHGAGGRHYQARFHRYPAFGCPTNAGMSVAVIAGRVPEPGPVIRARTASVVA